MAIPFVWLRDLVGLSNGSRRREAKRGRKPRDRNRALLELTRLEDRMAPAVRLALISGTTGTDLYLIEQIQGDTPSVTISEPTPGSLGINLGAGHFFDATSTAAGGLLSYNTASPTTSSTATVDIGNADNIKALLAALPGDGLILGNIANAAAGLDNLDASAQTVNVTGVVDTSHVTASQHGNVTLTAAETILVGSGGGVSASDGNITLTATGTFSGAQNFVGIDVDGYGYPGGTIAIQILEGGTGKIVLQGTGGNSGSNNYGIWVHEGARVQSFGSGTAIGAGSVTLKGTGGTGDNSNSNYGVFIADPGTQVSTASRNLAITGTGGRSYTHDNYGVDVLTGAVVSAGGAGQLTVSGMGASGIITDFGVVVGGSQVSTADGDLSITGLNGDAVNLASLATVQTTGTGNISVTADSLNIDTMSGEAATIKAGSNGTNVVTIIPQAPDTPLNLGTKVAAALGITKAELNQITAGNIDLGDEHTGTFTVSATIQHSGDANLNLTTGRDLVFNPGTSLTSVDGSLSFTAAGTILGDYTGITVNNATIKTTGKGWVSLNGKGGNAFFDTIPSGANHGIDVIGGAQVQATGSGTVILTGHGGTGTNPDGTGDNFGVFIIGSPTSPTTTTQVSTADGAVVITGFGGQGGADNFGVGVGGGAVVSAQGTGRTLTMQGFGGSGTDGKGNGGNGGVYIDSTSGSPIQLNTADGDLLITGSGGQGGEGSFGIGVRDGAVVSAGGVGRKLTLWGKAGSGTGLNYGVFITTFLIPTTSTIALSTANGDLSITGIAGDGSGGYNAGIIVGSGAVVSTGGKGNLTLYGTGGTGGTSGTGAVFDLGVDIINGGSVTTAGLLSVTGQAGDSSSTDVLLGPGSLLKGAGTITGSVTNDGQLSPGAPGIINLTGTYTQAPFVTGLPAGDLEVKIGAGQYDQLNVTGAVTLAGTLGVQLVNGFTPAAGATFTIITGASVSPTFANSSIPAGAGAFHVSYTANSVVLTYFADTTTSVVTANVNPSVYGQAVTFSATVTVAGGSAGTPTGTVQFYDGSTYLGTGTLNSAGIATFTTASLAAGTHNITAAYVGAVGFNGSASPSAFTLTVLSYSQATNNLIAQVNAAKLPGGLPTALDSKLQAAIAYFNAGDTADGISALKAFQNQVLAQKGKKIDATLADFLIAYAQEILNAVG